MVIIGGMRSFLGPALGALFFIIFRDFLSIWTPTLAALLRPAVRRLHPLFARGPGRARPADLSAPCWCRGRRSRPRRWRRGIVADAPRPLPDFLLRERGDRMTARARMRRASPKRFGGIVAVEGGALRVADRGAACADRPQRRRQDDALQPDLGHVPAGRAARSACADASIDGLPPDADHGAPASPARSRSPTCSRRLSVRRTCASAVQARDPGRFNVWRDAAAARSGSSDETRGAARLPGAAPMAGAPAGVALLWRPAAARHRLALAAKPALLLLDEPLAGLAAAERDRVADLDQAHLAHDRRCCWSSTTSTASSSSPIASPYERGQVLVDGSVEDVAAIRAVQEVYIGSGTAAIAAPRAGRRRAHAAR